MPWTPGGGGPTPRPLLGALYIKKLGIFFEIRTWLQKRLYKSGQNAEIAQEGAQFKSLFFQFEYGVHLHITACKSIAGITKLHYFHTLQKFQINFLKISF